MSSGGVQCGHIRSSRKTISSPCRRRSATISPRSKPCCASAEARNVHRGNGRRRVRYLRLEKARRRPRDRAALDAGPPGPDCPPLRKFTAALNGHKPQEKPSRNYAELLAMFPGGVITG